ncbi:hypothetical protein BDV12DRAFT_97424 [Aspergillus spectabilis]
MNSKPLQILQYNTARSKDVVMADFLRKPAVAQAEIIAVQEPWKNAYKDDTHHPIKQTHHLFVRNNGLSANGFTMPHLACDDSGETMSRPGVISSDMTLRQNRTTVISGSMIYQSGCFDMSIPVDLI